MQLSLRERILHVYKGKIPDVVPFMLDLSHWFYHKTGAPWDLSSSYQEPEKALVDYHKRMGVGFYMPNLAAFFSVEHTGGVNLEINKEFQAGKCEIVWRYNTPIGSIERRRIWNSNTYSWSVSRWGVESANDIRVLEYALTSRRYVPQWDNYKAWANYVGDIGVVYIPAGYSAVGQLLHYWMGIERFVYAAHDYPNTMREVVERINANNLECIDMLCSSPAEVIIMGDNFSSDVQPPHFFEEWSRDYYLEAISRLHSAGKFVAMHVDGRLKGALAMIRATGADCADAVTPAPMGDLTPDECRSEAGPELILSGGVSPELWLPNTNIEDFRYAVMRWLNLRKQSPRLIANAGDQVPPGAEESRIALMRDLVEKYGKY